VNLLQCLVEQENLCVPGISALAYLRVFIPVLTFTLFTYLVREFNLLYFFFEAVFRVQFSAVPF